MPTQTLGMGAADKYIADRESMGVERVEAEFSRLLRTAVREKRFGQFGVIVSLQSGAIKTFQRHAVETVK